ncbi:MAG: hypothetical protein ACJAZJ_000121 [Candidatus Endobugula sp.]|jgi:hypothetical protein
MWGARLDPVTFFAPVCLLSASSTFNVKLKRADFWPRFDASPHYAWFFLINLDNRLQSNETQIDFLPVHVLA